MGKMFERYSECRVIFVMRWAAGKAVPPEGFLNYKASSTTGRWQKLFSPHRGRAHIRVCLRLLTFANSGPSAEPRHQLVNRSLHDLRDSRRGHTAYGAAPKMMNRSPSTWVPSPSSIRAAA